MYTLEDFRIENINNNIIDQNDSNAMIKVNYNNTIVNKILNQDNNGFNQRSLDFRKSSLEISKDTREIHDFIRIMIETDI